MILTSNPAAHSAAGERESIRAATPARDAISMPARDANSDDG